MNQHLETWLSAVASELDLPAMQRDTVLDELRTHMQADFADRVSSGASEHEAMRATLAEMGDPEPVAAQLQRVHDGEGSAFRSSLGVLIMLFGFFGSLLAREWVSLVAEGRLTSLPSAWWWHDRLLTSLQWIVRHGLHERVLFPLALLGVSLIVGYIARRRGWKCALLPIVFVYGSITAVALLATGARLSHSAAATAALATEVLAVLGGAHLGAQLARWKHRHRRPLFVFLATIASLFPLLGWVRIAPQVDGRFAISLAGILVLGSLLVSLAVVVVLGLLARREPSAPA